MLEEIDEAIPHLGKRLLVLPIELRMVRQSARKPNCKRGSSTAKGKYSAERTTFMSNAIDDIGVATVTGEFSEK